MKCGRSPSETVLQVHHQLYVANKKPWEYATSDCITLCRGCHAREHGIIEPNRGWFLLSIVDLGGLDGTCERENCGNGIRYEHYTYHPQWGYKTLGSTCIEHLTQKDRALSGKLLACYCGISKFVHGSKWFEGRTKKQKSYIAAKHGHDYVRIYGTGKKYTFQVLLKVKGMKRYEFGELIRIPGKNLLEAKELAFITLKGMRSNDPQEKEMLRCVYRSAREVT